MKSKLFLLTSSVIACGLGFGMVMSLFVTTPAAAQIPLPDSTSTRSLLSQRLVWAHSMISYPLDLNVLYPYKPHGYSELYPLLQEQGLEQRTGSTWQARDIQAAKAAGIDGFSLDIFNTSAAAIPYLQAADQIGGFTIAPCLDLSTSRTEQKESDAFGTIDYYCRKAVGHPSAARIDGAFLIFTYGTEQLPVDAWKRVRARLAAAGDKTYWIVSVDTGGRLNGAKTFPASAISPYFDVFEGGYCFGPPGKWWDDMVSLFQQANRPFLGGMMPSYYRTGEGSWDADGTGQYRGQWRKYLGHSTPWAMITTWNDLQENTDIFPSADWNFTRSDLTRWYSAKFKGAAEPWTKPQLYVSTQKTAYPSQKSRAEALVLNPLSYPVTASIQFFNSEKKPIGEPATAVIPAGTAEAATQMLSLAELQPGSFLRAHAKILSGGKEIASVVSAPILILDPKAQPGFPTLYYSIPASRALPEPVKLTHENGEITYSVPASVHRRIAEVLQNTALVKNDLPGRTISQRLPSQPDNGMIVQYTVWGFKVGRVTDNDFRVGYSDPLYSAPPSRLELKEEYHFDEGQGSHITDLSPYHQTSKLVDVGWTTPGDNGSPACVSFNGRTSRIDLTVGQTPSGPVSLKLAVRPSAFGSTLYADAGGVVVSLRPDGKIWFARYTAGGFVTAYGSTPLVVGQWSQIRCTWDGQTSRLFVNGHLEGQAACGGGFVSRRRSLGCNPFGQGSDYYNGDIDDFELSTDVASVQP